MVMGHLPVAQRWHLMKNLCKHTHAGHTHVCGLHRKAIASESWGPEPTAEVSPGLAPPGISEEGSAPARPPSSRGPRCSWLVNTSPQSPLPSLQGVLPAAGASGPSVPFFIRTLVMLDQGHPNDLIFI